MSIVKHIEESDIVSSSIFPRVFIQLGLKFPSDREYFLVEIYILLSLVFSGPWEKGAKV